MELELMEEDFLKELASIGGGGAATSLSRILSQTIRLKVPEIYLLDYSQLFDRLGSPDQKVISVIANINEPTGGMMLFILDLAGANFIYKNVGLKEISNEDTALGELEESAVTEISNIMFNSYLGALSVMTGQTIISDKPFALLDMLGAVLNYPINVMPDMIDKIVFMDSEFFIDDHKINCSLLLISDYGNLKEHMKAFGV